MPTIYDNRERTLLPVLREALAEAERADFCVGYFNLRGWSQLADLVERLPGEDGRTCRVLIGMHRAPQEQLRALKRLTPDRPVDNAEVLRQTQRFAHDFAEQLTIGVMSAEDRAGLDQLVSQLERKKVTVKLYLRNPLHAKLYLVHTLATRYPLAAFLGSSNLTFSGLKAQGELNIDVADQDAAQKLSAWFEDHWQDRFCIDISSQLVQIIREGPLRPVTPYEIYIKMAYHLSAEARAGISEFVVPKDIQLYEFQRHAVLTAAQFINHRGGVLIGDVVGLGKTLMATALARIFEDDLGLETLIICPSHLVSMWQDYAARYRLRGSQVVSYAMAPEVLPELRRYRFVIIDESHTLRNRDGRRYRAISEYIATNDSRVVLLSATPYNLAYTDLANQLRLFLTDERELPIRPERLLQQLGGEHEFTRLHQSSPRSIRAFELSPHADDWRELMRHFMVRRTRSFILENYATLDRERQRRFLTLPDGTRNYFPIRQPLTVKFKIASDDPSDQYAQLYADTVVDLMNNLRLPRYGLAGYLVSPLPKLAEPEQRLLQALNRAGSRLKGFTRTGFFKRLESSGYAFLLTVERHVLRNLIWLAALESGGDVPVGNLASPALDDSDSDLEVLDNSSNEEGDITVDPELAATQLEALTPARLMERARQLYTEYRGRTGGGLKWLRSALFRPELAADLRADTDRLLALLRDVGRWDATRDRKLSALRDLLTTTYPREKVLIFSQFADTVEYLERRLRASGIKRLAAVSGDSTDTNEVVRRFSPRSNGGNVSAADELRVVLATDVLSEGQNLQDCAVIVNFDMPWAIIRLIQRAGRVDRIGQQADTIRVHTFLPEEGVERIIGLRRRVLQRLKENAEVMGSDERFFEEQDFATLAADIYTERAGALDTDNDNDVDLASYAYQIWKGAIRGRPDLKERIPKLSGQVASARALQPEGFRDSALVYLRGDNDIDTLAWIAADGTVLSEGPRRVLQLAACEPDEPALECSANHDELVLAAAAHLTELESRTGGQLGTTNSVRRRTYDRLTAFCGRANSQVFVTPDLRAAIQEIYRFPLTKQAIETIGRQLRAQIDDLTLSQLVVNLRDEDRLCLVTDEKERGEPQVLCSLGLR